MSDALPRALRWAIDNMPRPDGRTITIYTQNTNKNKYSALAYLKSHKKEYYDYLLANGLEQATYDKTL